MTSAARQQKNVIRVENLTKSFGGRIVVDHLSMSVKKGTIHGFLGSNGSGKTTTIRMLCGLLASDSGSGTCLGYNVSKDGEKLRRHVGYMTQRFSLYGDLTIRENLDFVARIHGLKNARRRISDAIEQWGLAGREKQLADTLSGGWKQRLALSACTLHDPDLLLLDEPTAGVDPKARRDFWAQIHALTADGISVLVSTHYMDEAERCHEISYIGYGKLLASGTIDDVIKASKLKSYLVTGSRVNEIQEELKNADGVDLITPFGASLHVCGHDKAKIERALEPLEYALDVDCAPSVTTLEDVFIYLMGCCKDNFDAS